LVVLLRLRLLRQVLVVLLHLNQPVPHLPQIHLQLVLR
jgi:hypothetical protein